MTGIPPANTGKWAKAALKTTLEQALKAPKTRKMRADMGRPSPSEVGSEGCGENCDDMNEEAQGRLKMTKRIEAWLCAPA